MIPVATGGGRIIASTKESGIFSRDDTGTHWKWFDPGVRTVPCLLRVSATGPRCAAFIHVSRDDGVTWERIKRTPSAYYGWYGRTAVIEIDPTNPDRIAADYYDQTLDHLRGMYLCDGRYMGDSGTEWNGWEWKQWFESGNQYRSRCSDDGDLIWVSSKSWQMNCPVNFLKSPRWP